MFVLTLAVIIWMLCSPAAAAAKVQRTVLLFHDARGDMPANVFVDQTIRSVLNPDFNVDLDVRSEYVEVSPFAKSDYPVLLSWLRRKYAGLTFDVVVPIGLSALRFVREYHSDLFNDAKIVYWGRMTGLHDWGSDPPITGVVAPEMESHAKATFQFIRMLQPDLKQLIVVSGTSEVDRNWEEAARRALRPFEGITITYLSGLALEDLQRRLMDLPKHTAILFLTVNRDAAERSLNKSEVLSEVVQEATAPVYSTSTLHLNTGIIGGALVNPETMSLEAAGLIQQLLHGKNIQELPVRESALQPTVNWRALLRWNIPADRLPDGTVVMYKDQSLWTQYKWHIISAVSVCVLEGALIVALLALRSNRRRAEKAMRESQRLLQSAIDALDARVALLDQEGTIITVNEPWRSFARANGYDALVDGAEQNYLRVCECGIAEEGRVVSNGIRALLSGELVDFRSVYPSVQDGETSWFQVRINTFHVDGVLRLVVANENVTEIKRAHDAQQQLTGLLLRAQDDERRRIARDLHDVTVQDLVSIRADLTRIQRPSDSMNRGVNQTLEESVSLCDRVIKELRTLSYLLHPPLLDEAGLLPALRWFVRGFIQRSDIQVELLVMDDIGRLGIDAEIALFRVVQECLTNVHRHSGSRSAVIWVRKEEGTVRVQITDEGHGFSVPSGAGGHEAVLPTGVGIIGMRQRLKQFGGELNIESNSEGTTVNARMPVSEERDATYSLG